MLDGILLIGFIIVISGFIAYLGDQVGMRVGKKRISLFGLRPRYTSIIITIITGLLISALTLTFILVINDGIRQMIFSMREVREKIENLETRLAGMKKEYQSTLERYQGDIDKLQDKIGSLNSNIDKLEEERVRLEKENQEIKKENKKLQQKNNDLLASNEELQQEKKELNDQITLLRDEYVTLYEQAKNYISSYQEKDIVYERGDEIYFDVIETNQSQEEIVQDITEFLDRANEIVRQRPVMVDEELGTALWIQEEEIFNVARAIINSEHDRLIIGLVSTINVPRDSKVYARFVWGKDFIVFKEGELITRKIIDAGKTPVELQQALEELLTTIRIKAEKRGILTNREGMSGFGFGQFYELMNNIQSYDGQVEVKVFARKNIWREDGDKVAANLTFEINPQSEGSNMP